MRGIGRREDWKREEPTGVRVVVLDNKRFDSFFPVNACRTGNSHTFVDNFRGWLKSVTPKLRFL
jgi:hypothetical protein